MPKRCFANFISAQAMQAKSISRAVKYRRSEQSDSDAEPTSRDVDLGSIEHFYRFLLLVGLDPAFELGGSSLFPALLGGGLGLASSQCCGQESWRCCFCGTAISLLVVGLYKEAKRAGCTYVCLCECTWSRAHVVLRACVRALVRACEDANSHSASPRLPEMSMHMSRCVLTFRAALVVAIMNRSCFARVTVTVIFLVIVVVILLQ